MLSQVMFSRDRSIPQKASHAYGPIEAIVEDGSGTVIELAPISGGSPEGPLGAKAGFQAEGGTEAETQAPGSKFESLAEILEQRRGLQKEIDDLKVAVEHMPHGLCMFDAKRRLITSNLQFARMYGLSADDVLPGTKLEEIIDRRIVRGVVPEADAEDYMRRSLRIASSPASETTFMQLGDGRTIAVVFRPLNKGGWVATHEDITERIQLNSILERMAYEDPLTKLPNAARLQERLQQAASRGEDISAVYVDVDRFKEINDAFGHSRGSQILQEIARRLVREANRDDLVARLGGDEFVIICDGARIADTTALAERILLAFEEPFQNNGSSIQLSTSIGIAVSERGCNAQQLTNDAALALDNAKSLGRQRYCVFEPAMFRQATERRQLLSDLRSALSTGQLDLAYQPIVKSDTGQVTSFEALLRWDHPVRGAVSPAEFIPLAEEEGLMGPIGNWIFREACTACASWAESIGVTVNISATQFRSADIAEVITSALAATGLSPSRLSIEITETSLLLSNKATMDVLNGLRALGVGVAMDDFGTGYSSLSYLSSFPFSKVKIDRCFVRDSESSKTSRRMLEAILTMTKVLQIPSIVEGVETAEQLDVVRNLGCSEIQGFLFGRPMRRVDIARWLDTRKCSHADAGA